MREFLTVTFPNLVKTLLVLVLVIFTTVNISPPIIPDLYLETPLGHYYVIPLLCGAMLGMFMNRFINGIWSLGFLAVVTAALFEYGYLLRTF